MSTKAATSQEKKLHMTFEEYDAWSFQQEARTEWVNGEVIYQMAVSKFHQRIVNFLIELLGLYIRLFQLGEISSGPEQARIHPDIVREPDLFFISSKQVEQHTDKRFEGVPLLIVEVVSDGSVKHDRETKWKEYRKAGVKEYWIIDPRPGKERADFYRFDQDNFELVATEEDKRVESKVLDEFWLNPDWLWQTDLHAPLLKVMEITNWSADQIAKKLASNK